MKKLNVLIACEYSGKIREAFRAKGHNAWSCDLLPSDDNSPYHYTGDCFNLLNDLEPDNPHFQNAFVGQSMPKWDLVIAHPPCTYLTNAGVCWLHKDSAKQTAKERWVAMDEAAGFFASFIEFARNNPQVAVAIENPIMHKHAKQAISSFTAAGYQDQSQVIQPWMFGHPESKATCLWLWGLPELFETDNVKELRDSLPQEQRQRLHWLPPTADRWKIRSETFQGIADAMAQQWGEFLMASKRADAQAVIS